jgi:hypothetical protein
MVYRGRQHKNSSSVGTYLSGLDARSIPLCHQMFVVTGHRVVGGCCGLLVTSSVTFLLSNVAFLTLMRRSMD